MRFQAALDPPAETKRQFLTLVIWAFFLASAVLAAAFVGTHMPGMVDPVTVDPQGDGPREELQRSHLARVKVAFLIGLASPALCALWLRRRYRRHGVYPRGITVELTAEELRIWGRGYGSRVAIRGAALEERLVDVYAGRLGAWRQIRMRVRTSARHIELAAQADERDRTRGLRLDGGEGDCVELDREDYDALRGEILRRTQTTTDGADGAVAAEGAEAAEVAEAP
jgi:hypothetical protein